MPAQQITDLFLQQRTQIANTTRLEGDFRFVNNDRIWMGEGLNANKGNGQTTRITFSAPGELAPNGVVYFVITRNVDGVKYPTQLEIRNTGTTPLNLAQAVADRINGTQTIVPVADLNGYVAATVTATPVVTVNITSTPGESFGIETGNFGVSQNGVTNPVAPAIVTTIAAGSAVPIPFGRALVTDITTTATAYGQQDGVVALEPNKIVNMPSGTATERFVGWSYRPGATYMTPALSDRNLEAYFTGYPVCFVRNEPLHGQQILLRLEQFPPATTLPASLVGQEIYYRKTQSGGFLDLGAPSLLGAADTTRQLAADNVTNRPWIVMEVADAAFGLVWAGLKGYQ